MKEIHLDSWFAFAETVAGIRRDYSGSQLLFRGQADCRWELKTTLERRATKKFDVLSYTALALHYVNELRSITGHKWETMDYPQVQENIAAKQKPSTLYLPCYDYLAYLRHHGFASPLLDWTESPYVAAFFAFCDPPPQQVCDGLPQRERAALFVYNETPSGGKGGE